MSATKIEWCKRPGTKPEVWNVVTGCNKVSQGCKNCYAEVMHKRLQGMYPEKYNHDFLSGAHEHDDLLHLPLKWKTPRTVFVNSMSDLFHENVSFEFINGVFTVMSDLDQHTYIILTKRPERILEFIKWKQNQIFNIWMPSDNVWIGVSVEDQKTANERIPLLLQIPTAVRFLSCEPLLGALNIYDAFPKDESCHIFSNVIDWVIVGGESGHKARPMHPDWVIGLRNQCKEAKIPFFFKQWGEYKPDPRPFTSKLKWIHHAQGWLYGWKRGKDICLSYDGTHCLKGSDFDTCTYPVYPMRKVGKVLSGNILNGKQYLEFPKTETNA